MKISHFVTLMVVLGLTFLGLWQFSAWFRNALGLKGRPLDWLLGTGGTNNGPAIGGGESGGVGKAMRAIGSASGAPAPEVAAPQLAAPLPDTGQTSITRAVGGLKNIIGRVGIDAIANQPPPPPPPMPPLPDTGKGTMTNAVGGLKNIIGRVGIQAIATPAVASTAGSAVASTRRMFSF